MIGDFYIPQSSIVKTMEAILKRTASIVCGLGKRNVCRIFVRF